MYAYEFIARDRAGLLFQGNNGGTGEWISSRHKNQWNDATFQEDYFLEFEKWFDVPSHK